MASLIYCSRLYEVVLIVDCSRVGVNRSMAIAVDSHRLSLFNRGVAILSGHDLLHLKMEEG